MYFSVLILVFVLMAVFVLFFGVKTVYRQKKLSKKKTPSYIEDIMKNLERSEKMNKSNVVNKKGIEASEDDRINKIIAVIDKRLIDFNMDFLKVEAWIKASVKSVSDAYHAGFYLSQVQAQTRGYNLVDSLVFGARNVPVEEDDDVFDEEPVQMVPVETTQPKTDTKATSDAINDFLDNQKKNRDDMAPEVA